MRWPLRRAVELLDDVVEQDAVRPVRPWMWGPALLGFALAEVERAVGARGYEAWLRRFADHHLAAGARPVSADTIAPGLVTTELADTGTRYEEATRRALDAILDAPALPGAGPDVSNHLGASTYARFYPPSAWVDSLMMTGVLAAREGARRGEAALVRHALAMPGQYAVLLVDRETGLWSHAWWAPGGVGGRAGRRFPRLPWARGNAWVIAALPLILEAADAAGPGEDGERVRAARLLEETSSALAARQRPDGSWPTLLAARGGYRELSATALIGFGWLRAVRLGLLAETYVAPARRAVACAVGAVDRVGGRWSMPEVSGPTIPLPVFPRAGYLAVRPGRDRPWGTAALALAAIEDDLLG
ncbi:Rhamnogalacturonides degradation protein RhiN [Actinomycetales bacterium JB111]|nr:Rhamnogalacturonides degradation protein RhiN [Actinomycetales bacterium JB111]